MVSRAEAEDSHTETISSLWVKHKAQLQEPGGEAKLTQLKVKQAKELEEERARSLAHLGKAQQDHQSSLVEVQSRNTLIINERLHEYQESVKSLQEKYASEARAAEEAHKAREKELQAQLASADRAIGGFQSKERELSSQLETVTQTTSQQMQQLQSEIRVHEERSVKLKERRVTEERRVVQLMQVEQKQLVEKLKGAYRTVHGMEHGAARLVDESRPPAS